MSGCRCGVLSCSGCLDPKSQRRPRRRSHACEPATCAGGCGASVDCAICTGWLKLPSEAYACFDCAPRLFNTKLLASMAGRVD